MKKEYLVFIIEHGKEAFKATCNDYQKNYCSTSNFIELQLIRDDGKIIIVTPGTVIIKEILPMVEKIIVK